MFSLVDGLNQLIRDCATWPNLHIVLDESETIATMLNSYLIKMSRCLLILTFFQSNLTIVRHIVKFTTRIC